MIPIVLASASPRRKALLNALGIDVEVVASHAEETRLASPGGTVLENARRKRDAVAPLSQTPDFVVGVDTVVVLGETIIGKPLDLEEAQETLARLSGQTHEVYTGAALVRRDTGRAAEGYETTRVTFRLLSSEEIARFVEAVRPIDRAGAYTADGPGSLLISAYSGCYQNVLGLPIVRLDELFREIGDSLFAHLDPARARFL